MGFKKYKIKNINILIYVISISFVFIAILSISKYFLQNKITNAELAYRNKQLSDLLSDIKYNNNLLESKLNIDFNLINKKNHNKLIYNNIYIAKNTNIPTAAIVNITTPDGYNGNINILVAINLKSKNNNHNKIIGTKILNHNETPGLGDLIEPEKSNWLKQFVNKFIPNHANNWGFKKDNKTNQFDSITGATITSRAVTNAIYNSLNFINNNPDIIKKND